MRPRRGKKESCSLSCAEEGLLAVRFIDCFIGMIFKLMIFWVLPNNRQELSRSYTLFILNLKVCVKHRHNILRLTCLGILPLTFMVYTSIDQGISKSKRKCQMFIVIVFQQLTKAHVGRTLKQSCFQSLQDYKYSAPWFCAKRCTTVYTNFGAATRRLNGCGFAVVGKGMVPRVV